MPRLHFTDRAVRSLSTDRIQQDWWDTSFPAFGVRVARTGRRTFFVRYRAAGRQRRVKLGDYPAVSLATARTRARQVLGELATGHDPAAGRELQKQGPTFTELAAEYLERHAKVHKRKWRQDERDLERELLPVWGRLKAAHVSKADVLQVLDRKMDSGAPIAANRLLSLIRKIFNWGIERDLVATNPCLGVKPPAAERRRERVLSASELRLLWNCLPGEVQSVRAAFQLLILTAQRSIEVLTMRWSDIDGDVWTVPAGVVKGKRAHPVPLSPQAREILEGLIRNEGDDWVMLSPRQPGARLHNTSLSHAAQRLRTAAGFDWRTHDLRRTAASHMAGLGVRRFVVSRILNHADPSVTAIYDRHSYLPEMREALELWGRRVHEILSVTGS